MKIYRFNIRITNKKPASAAVIARSQITAKNALKEKLSNDGILYKSVMIKSVSSVDIPEVIYEKEDLKRNKR